MCQNPHGRHDRVISMVSCPRCSLHVDIFLNGELIGRAPPVAECIMKELTRLTETNMISRKEAVEMGLVVVANAHYLLTEEQMEMMMFQVFVGIGLVIDIPVEQLFGWPPKQVSPTSDRRRRT